MDGAAIKDLSEHRLRAYRVPGRPDLTDWEFNVHSFDPVHRTEENLGTTITANLFTVIRADEDPIAANSRIAASFPGAVPVGHVSVNDNWIVCDRSVNAHSSLITVGKPAPLKGEQRSFFQVVASELVQRVGALESVNIDQGLQLAQLEESQRRKDEDIERLTRIAYSDELTGLLNRRGLKKSQKDLLNTDEKIGVVFFDLDHFKKTNDTYGHDAGDAVLIHVSNILREMFFTADADWSVKPGVIVSRTGGEEFAILLAGKSEQEVYRIANEFRERLKNSICLDPETGARIPVTASCGVAMLVGGLDNIGAVMKQADRALYSAKHSGRDRVCLASHLPEDLEGSSRQERRSPDKRAWRPPQRNRPSLVLAEDQPRM